MAHSVCYKLAGQPEKAWAEAQKASPVIQIYQYPGIPPRAYHAWPAIHEAGGHHYMSCPVDYRGRHYRPQDGTPLSAAKSAFCSAADIAHAGKIVHSRPMRGAEMPASCWPFSQRMIKVPGVPDEKTALKIFIAAGRSLEVVKDCLYHLNTYGKGDIGFYFQLWNPTAASRETRAPELHTAGGIHYLVYKIDPSKTDHCCPPDSIPVSTAEYLWAQRDREDRAQGIIPPPPPTALSHLQPVKPIATPRPGK